MLLLSNVFGIGRETHRRQVVQIDAVIRVREIGFLLLGVPRLLDNLGVMAEALVAVSHF